VFNGARLMLGVPQIVKGVLAQMRALPDSEKLR